MNKKIVMIGSLISATSILFSGCKFSVGNITFGSNSAIVAQKAANNAEDTNDKSNLDEDTFYVLRDGKYIPLYFGNSSFKQGETASQPSKDRLLWYIDDNTQNSDVDRIPILYKNDQLVYRYSDTLDEEFNFERFYDLGRSFGIYGLQETKSGRYSMEINPEQMYPDSDVYGELSTLTSETAIIEQVETMKLRVGYGLVSEYGTIVNFAFDDAGNVVDADPTQEYRFLVYNGTFKNKFSFKPTYRILGSAEDYISYDYTFVDDDVIEVTIPTWFESGYYLINGVGVFKYINAYSDELSGEAVEKLNLNVPTNTEGLEGNFKAISETTETAAGAEYTDIYGDYSDDLLKALNYNEEGYWEMMVNTPGAYNISVKLEIEPLEGVERDEPTCSLTTGSGDTYYANYDAENSTLVFPEVYLATGMSRFTFGEMPGVTPTFEIEKRDE